MIPTPPADTTRFERQQLIALPRSDVFSFFADAWNLERLTPPLMHFRILTPLPMEMKPGALIEYSLRLHGLPIRWRTLIAEFEPPCRFVDFQLRGPYRYWRHLHTFEETPEGTLMRDVVDYAVPAGRLGEFVGGAFVRRALCKIFDYRREAVATAFGPEPRSVAA